MKWYVVKAGRDHLIYTASDTHDGCIQAFAKTKLSGLRTIHRNTAEAIYNEYASQQGYRVEVYELTPTEPYPGEEEQSIEEILPEAYEILDKSMDINPNPNNI